MAPRRPATSTLSQSLDRDDAQPKHRSRKASSAKHTPHEGAVDVAKAAADVAKPASKHVSRPGAHHSFTSLSHFAITAVVTLTLQTLCSAVVEQTRGVELGSVSRHFQSTWSVLGLLGWKVLELAVGWFAGYGNVAIAPFIALLRLPHMYLLNAFYDVPFFPLFIELFTHFFSASLAFSIFRRPAVYAPVKASGVIDRTMRGDLTFQVTSAAFSTALYALPILASIYTWLPVHLAVHWDGLKNLEKAHNETVMSMFQHLVGMGWCTMYLLLDFVPTSSDVNDARVAPDNEVAPFDPTTAGLMEHLNYNIDNLLFWRHAKPAGRALLKHTIFLALCLTVDAAFQSCATIEGCEVSGLSWIYGPLPWGGLWGFGMVVSGIALGWVAAVFV